jgi:hypothetical protein
MSKQLITPLAILSYPHLDQPQPSTDGKPPKYSAALVFTKELLSLPGEQAKLDAMVAAGQAAIEAKWPGKLAELLKSENFKKGFRKDGEEKGYPAGSIFVNVRSGQQPGTVYAYAGPDGKKPAQMPTDKIKAELYPGAIVRASVTAFAYDTSGNRGVSFGLNNIQKVRDGDRLDNRVAAENEFDIDLSAAPADLSAIAGLI